MIMLRENEKVDQAVLQCKKCGRKLNIFSFYRYRNSEERFHVCKDCILSQLDIYNPDTFLWVLQELDVPFIEYEWNAIVERHNNKSVLGRYLSKMKLKGFRVYGWNNGKKLNEYHRKQRSKYL